MSGTLLIINDPPYGTERAYNALRLARALVGKDGETVRIFLIGDAVSCARSGQQVAYDAWYDTLQGQSVLVAEVVSLIPLLQDAPAGHDGRSANVSSRVQSSSAST